MHNCHNLCILNILRCRSFMAWAYWTCWRSLHAQLSWPGHFEYPYIHNCHGLDILRIPVHTQLSWPGHIEYPYIHNCHGLDTLKIPLHAQLSWPRHNEDPFTCTIVMAWTYWRSRYMHDCHGLDTLKIPLHAQLLSWTRLIKHHWRNESLHAQSATAWTHCRS